MDDDFEDVNEEGMDEEEFSDMGSDEEGDYEEEDLESCGYLTLLSTNKMNFRTPLKYWNSCRMDNLT